MQVPKGQSKPLPEGWQIRLSAPQPHRKETIPLEYRLETYIQLAEISLGDATGPSPLEALPKVAQQATTNAKSHHDIDAINSAQKAPPHKNGVNLMKFLDRFVNAAPTAAATDGDPNTVSGEIKNIRGGGANQHGPSYGQFKRKHSLTGDIAEMGDILAKRDLLQNAMKGIGDDEGGSSKRHKATYTPEDTPADKSEVQSLRHILEESFEFVSELQKNNEELRAALRREQDLVRALRREHRAQPEGVQPKPTAPMQDKVPQQEGGNDEKVVKETSKHGPGAASCGNTDIQLPKVTPNSLPNNNMSRPLATPFSLVAPALRSKQVQQPSNGVVASPTHLKGPIGAFNFLLTPPKAPSSEITMIPTPGHNINVMQQTTAIHNEQAVLVTPAPAPTTVTTVAAPQVAPGGANQSALINAVVKAAASQPPTTPHQQQPQQQQAPLAVPAITTAAAAAAQSVLNSRIIPVQSQSEVSRWVMPSALGSMAQSTILNPMAVEANYQQALRTQAMANIQMGLVMQQQGMMIWAQQQQQQQQRTQQTFTLLRDDPQPKE